MKPILKFVLPRLRERSTYLGLVALLTACGVAIEPDYLEIAISVGSAIAGVVGVVWPDTRAA